MGLWRRCLSAVTVLLFFAQSTILVLCLPTSPPGNQKNGLKQHGPQSSRRNLLFWPVGIASTAVYGKLVVDSAKKLSRGKLAFPEDHERRVKEVISRTTLASINLLKERDSIRVLEVGIGTECRLIRRGLYDEALAELSTRGISKFELVGIDISMPSVETQRNAEARLQRAASQSNIETTFELRRASITSQLQFQNGCFDAVICSLTLCSVDNQDAALDEIKRILRPDGGTFGYVEHVAVNPEEPYRILELQQEIFDPLQRVVADNCHLHRFTDDNIARAFGLGTTSSDQAALLFTERYLVDDMWPVSCQAAGVIQKRIVK